MFDRDCVISTIEDAFPNPQDAKRLFDIAEKHPNSDAAAQYNAVASDIREFC
jgi:hypothetical protein